MSTEEAATEADRIHAAAQPLYPTPFDLIDVERRVIDIYGHKMLAIDLWLSPVLQDEPIYHLGIIVDPEGALAVHLLSPEQYAAAFQQHTDQETNSNG